MTRRLEKKFDIIKCNVKTKDGSADIPSGVVFVQYPLNKDAFVRIFYGEWGYTYDLSPSEWERLLQQELAVPRPKDF